MSMICILYVLPGLMNTLPLYKNTELTINYNIGNIHIKQLTFDIFN